MAKDNDSKKTAAGSSRGLTPDGKRLALILIAAVFASATLYFVLVGFARLWKPAVIVWTAAASVTIIAYFIINKGFTENGITPEMLPDSMSEEEKAAYIEKSLGRKKKSRWMLVVFIALIFPLAADIFRLFVFERLLPEGIAGLFGK